MLRNNYYLIHLIEECSEVMKEATKILRFGWDSDNIGRLSEELGDVLNLLDKLKEEGLIDTSVLDAREFKKEKGERGLQRAIARGVVYG